MDISIYNCKITSKNLSSKVSDIHNYFILDIFLEEILHVFEYTFFQIFKTA